MFYGIFCTFAAYILWGLFPFYFHALADIGALEILAHRVVWSLLFIVLVILVMRRTAWLKAALTSPRILLIFTASALLVGANWGTYVYAIVTDRTIEASLGYFINPLVSILLSAVFLREKLRPAQKIAVGLAAVGVLWISWVKGVPPFLGLALAFTFGVYGLIRKIAPLGSIEGLTLESLILTPIALLWLGYLGSTGELAFAEASGTTQLLLIATGPITAIPLLLFASGVRSIPYSTSAIIQYVSPSMVFLIGVFAFNEPFTLEMLIGFLFIWTAVALFLGETVLMQRRQRLAARKKADEV